MNRVFWLMPKSVLTVMMIWFVIISFFYPLDYLNLGWALLTSLALILVAGMGGVIIWFMYSNVLLRDAVTSSIEGKTRKQEISVCLYSSSDPRKTRKYYPKIPFPLSSLPTSSGSKKLLKSWGGYLSYKRDFPEHAKVFDAIFEVLAHYDYLPATHHPEGHGGASLIAHSVNVVRTMDRLGGAFKYYGLYHGNKLVYPLQEESSLQSGFYSFSRNDPILPIIALAHDIGKTVAYQPIETTELSRREAFARKINSGYERKTVAVKRVKGSHDLLGKKVILLIPEIYLLTWKDRLDILTAVGYHHHHKKGVMVDNCYLQPLPFTNEISDRQHALAALLDYVDIQTGFLEGGKKIRPFETPNSVQKKSEEPEKPSGKVSDKKETVARHVAQKNQVESEVDADEIEDGEAIVFKWLCEMIKEESRSKRGNSRLNRLDGWVYLDETHWKTWLFKKGKSVVDQEMLTLKTPGVLHSTTVELLQSFKEKSALPVDPGRSGSPGLFSISVERMHGDPFIREGVIVFKESVLPFTVTLKQSNRKIQILALTTEREVVDTPPTAAETESPSPVKVKQENDTKNSEAQRQSEEGVVKKGNTEALVEWVTLVQNLEFPDTPPFPEEKIKGVTYASVDVLSIPERFIEEGGFGADKRLIMNEETGFILIPVELRKKMR